MVNRSGLHSSARVGYATTGVVRLGLPLRLESSAHEIVSELIFGSVNHVRVTAPEFTSSFAQEAAAGAERCTGLRWAWQ